MGAADGLDHRLVGDHAREEPIDQPVDLADAEERREPLRELVHLELALLELAKERQPLPTLAKERLDGVGLEPLGLAEGPERFEHVGGEHTAEVDEQSAAVPVAAIRIRAPSAHACGAGSFVISCAASASCGTPWSKSFRYGSSVVPASERL